VNPAAEGIAADHPKQPECEQNDGDRPKHFSSPDSCPAQRFCLGPLLKIND
jgi:hypothetical protein